VLGVVLLVSVGAFAVGAVGGPSRASNESLRIVGGFRIGASRYAICPLGLLRLACCELLTPDLCELGSPSEALAANRRRPGRRHGGVRRTLSLTRPRPLIV